MYFEAYGNTHVVNVLLEFCNKKITFDNIFLYTFALKLQLIVDKYNPNKLETFSNAHGWDSRKIGIYSGIKEQYTHTTHSRIGYRIVNDNFAGTVYLYFIQIV